MSATTHQVHAGVWFVEELTPQLRISLGHFHVRINSVSQLAVLSQFLLTQNKRHVRKPRVNEYTDPSLAKHRPTLLPCTQ